MVSKRYMRKYDTCVGHEAHINKLLLKKPPGITSASSTSSVCEQCADQPSKAFTERGRKKEGNKRQRKNMKGGRRKETNPESSARRKIFGDGLRSMGLARVGCQMRCIDGMHRR